MTSFAVKTDLDSIRETVSYFEFVGGQTTDAVRIAINKTTPKAKTLISQGITSRVNLKAAYVKGKINLTRATRQKLGAKVYANSRGVLLSKYEYGAKASLYAGIFTPDSPIRVKILKQAGSIKTVDGDKDTYGKPFYFRLKGGGGADGITYGIGGWRRPRGGRIKAFLAPSVSQEFDESRDKKVPEIADYYQSQLLNAMNYILKKQYPKE